MQEQLEIKQSRLGHFIILLLVLLLLGIVVWAFYFKEDPLIKDVAGIMICAFIGLLGCVVLYFNLKMLIKNPAVLKINADGFEYNPGGVSSGWVQWSNVEELKYVDVRSVHGNVNGVNLETVFSVKLKDNTSYLKQYNFTIRDLMQTTRKMYDTDILFSLSSFGKRLDEVVALMNKNWDASKKEIIE
jgi:hypothetical protein